MVLVDGDVASDIVGSYMTWISCMLKEIELIILVGVIYLYSTYRSVFGALAEASGGCTGGLQPP